MILHIYAWDKKFIPPFLEFMETHFPVNEHEHLVLGDAGFIPMPKFQGKLTVHKRIGKSVNGLRIMTDLIRRTHKAEKVILHGLWNGRVVQMLWAMPWLLKKCYWVIWGGDLYHFSLGERNYQWHQMEFYRRPVIRNMGHLVTYIPGDAALARQWYGARGEYHECIMYPSNVFHSHISTRPNDGITRILVGNSADPSNNHLEIFEKLKPHKYENIQIICPLSYGDKVYACEMTKRGNKEFKERFTALSDFLSIEAYRRLLSTIDVALFAHNRQQGMGNILNLLGNGASVFLKSSTTTWALCQSLGLKVYDFHELTNLKLLTSAEKENNEYKVRTFFSIDTLRKQYKQIFES